MNEETIIEKRPTVNAQTKGKEEGHAWKQVTLGGVSGILMGAGLMYAGQAMAKEPETAETPTVEAPTVEAPEAGETSHTLENGLRVAAVGDDLSFGEAFAQARAEVGPGGVFHWHGGIYNTYSADEWNSMTIAQKHDFAQQVQPEIHPDELSTPTDANTHVVVVHHVHHYENHAPVEDAPQPTPTADDVRLVEQQIAQNFDMGDDVHIVGYANAEGHLVVGYDMTGDNQADVAIIDMDNNFQPSDADVILDREGNMATLGELDTTPDPCQSVPTEVPDSDADVSSDYDGMTFDA